MISNPYGFVMLTSKLGDPARKPLTSTQIRFLFKQVSMTLPDNINRDLVQDDIIKLGFSEIQALQILGLLSDKAKLNRYLERGLRAECYVACRNTDNYPAILRRKLGLDAPGCLWYKGNSDFLAMPKVSVVGNRDLCLDNKKFAEKVGKEAAHQGFALVSGNARGADRTAQEACLSGGGYVISVVADSLANHPKHDRILYISESDYDTPFSPQKALSRNRIIHALGEIVFVVQCNEPKGGTWDGTIKNLREGYTAAYCFQDNSEVSRLLEDMGAHTIGMDALPNISDLIHAGKSMFDLDA